MSEELLVSLIGVGGAVVVVALVEVVKRSWPELEPRRYPLVAIVMGIALNLAVAYLLSRRLDYAVLLGVLAGLVAGGMWSGMKAAVIEPREAAETRERLRQPAPRG